MEQLRSKAIQIPASLLTNCGALDKLLNLLES